MNNTVLKNVINIAYVLIYIGANPNIFAGNAIVLLFFFFYGLTIAIESKQRFDAIILIPILVFALINFISVLKWGGLSTEFLSNYVGYNIRFLTAYFFLKYVIANFFSFYDKTVYILALISVPFWLVQLFDFSFFHDYLDFINLTVDDDSRERWSFLIYTAYPSWVTDGLLRNSGFTSEPSFFGFILSLRLTRNNIKIDRKMWIVMIIGLSTLSTTYLISLIMIFAFVAFNQKKVSYKILSILGVGIFLFSFYASSFGMKKINLIVDDFLVTKSNVYKWPWGYGLNDNGLLKTSSGVVIKGSGSLLNNCIHWGVSFLIFFPILIGRFWRTLKYDLSLFSRMLLLMMTCAWSFSSIEFKDPLFFVIICIGLMQYVPVSVPVCKNGRVGLVHLRYTDSILNRFREKQLLKSISNRKRDSR